MNKNKILLVAILMAGLVSLAVADTFSVDLYLDNASAKSLTFGMGSERVLVGVPPFEAPANLNVAWLEGPGDVSDAKIDEDFSKLSTYVKKSADAGMWKLYVRNGMKITFKTTGLPNGSILKCYQEDDEENAIDITNGTILNATADTTYLIDYRKSSNTDAALPSPQVKHVQMSSSKKKLDVDFGDDIPTGCSLVVASKAKVYKSVDEGEYTIFEEITNVSGTVATDGSATATLTMTSMANVARVQFEYWFKDGEQSSEKAVVIVDVTKGLKTSLVEKKDVATEETINGAVVAVDPEAEGYDGTVLTYKIDFDNETLGKALTLTVDTPKFAPDADAYAIGYYFTDDEDGEGEFAAVPGSYTSKASTIYLKVKATLTSKCEPGFVRPSITIGDNTVELEAVQFIVMSGGTMDIDGDGTISEEDAIMMYIFVLMGGVDNPDDISADTLLQGIDENKQDQVDADAALALLQALPTFLDYDGDGDITEEDAIMLYVFILMGGVDNPDDISADTLLQAIDESKQDLDKAETALANFQRLSQK